MKNGIIIQWYKLKEYAKIANISYRTALKYKANYSRVEIMQGSKKVIRYLHPNVSSLLVSVNEYKNQ